MSKYATISVPKEVRELLARKKGRKEWGEYLLELYTMAERARVAEGLGELRKLLTEAELDEILRASKEFREGFRLR